jgi:hypothetical protein
MQVNTFQMYNNFRIKYKDIKFNRKGYKHITKMLLFNFQHWKDRRCKLMENY